LILALVLVAIVCGPLWRWSADSKALDGPTRWTPERLGRLFIGPEQALCYACFIWACFILASRYREVRRQRQAFALPLLPPDVCILPEDARLLQRRLDQQLAGRGPYLLANLLKLALGKYAVSRSGRDVSELVRTQADVDLGRFVSSMSMVHYLAWAIPAIGFLGTVRGLAGSLSVGKLKTSEFVAQATHHLNIAFDCTLIALALSVVLMFLLHLVQREEEKLVIDCQQFALDHLVTRLYEADPASGEAAGSGSLSLTEIPPTRRFVPS
jgi:biopolymer transport protein ExbB/TolQ